MCVLEEIVFRINKDETEDRCVERFLRTVIYFSDDRADWMCVIRPIIKTATTLISSDGRRSLPKMVAVHCRVGVDNVEKIC